MRIYPLLAALLPLTIASALALAASGCERRRTPGPSPAPGAAAEPNGERTITVDGRDRTFRWHAPAAPELSHPPASQDGKRPLVVMLHGGFGTGEQAEANYGWDALADAEGFAVAYPDGIDRAWSVGGGCCGNPGRDGVDDVAFIRAVVDQMRSIVPGGVDPARIYATGISNGGLMAYRLACDTDLFAAIGPDSATLLGPCDQPAPVSVLHIHGTADTRIRMDGERGDGIARIDGPPVADVVAAWRGVDGCGPERTVVAGVVSTTSAQCPGERAVELIAIDGAGHQWPGSPSKPLLQKALGTDEPSTAVDATATFWAFFAAHPKR